MPDTPAFLTIKHLSHTYHTKQGETNALEDISFSLYPGDFTAIVGCSGCGKSTLLDLIGGFLPLQEGEILYHPPNPKIGYMLQKDHLLEYRNIIDNITLGLEIHHQKTKENMEFVEKLMMQYGISAFARSHPSQLSGGMRQRAALIRTLSIRPDFLLLDEPFSALDYQTRIEVAEDIFSILREQNIPVLLVTHDLSEAVSMADKIIVLGKRPGKIRNIITIDYEEETRPTPVAARSHPKFQQYFQQLWKELKTDGQSCTKTISASYEKA